MLNDEFLYGICDFALLKNRLIDCGAKQRLPADAQSVILILFPYYPGKEFYENSCISKYAVAPDYHIIIKKYLNGFISLLKEKYKQNKFEGFVDNSPIPEVYAAAVSSLGVIGENSLLINDRYGSYVFIGAIVSDYKFKCTYSQVKKCVGCGMCRKACPNEAISEIGIVREKCLSDITQRKGEIDPESIEKIVKSGCVWGCDICQDVCSMNKSAQTTFIPEFKENLIPSPKIPVCIENRAYAFRGKKTIERNLMWLEKN